MLFRSHAKTKFELYGVHSRIECSKCHFKTKLDGTVLQLFKELTGNCENCHIDIHAGQFISDNKTNCNKCHTYDNWNPDNFLHDSTRFKLDGKHINVKCEKCHKSTIINNQLTINYKFDNVKCINCHS